jgi:hypothetical protein
MIFACGDDNTNFSGLTEVFVDLAGGDRYAESIVLVEVVVLLAICLHTFFPHKIKVLLVTTGRSRLTCVCCLTKVLTGLADGVLFAGVGLVVEVLVLSAYWDGGTFLFVFVEVVVLFAYWHLLAFLPACVEEFVRCACGDDQTFLLFA